MTLVPTGICSPDFAASQLMRALLIGLDPIPVSTVKIAHKLLSKKEKLTWKATTGDHETASINSNEPELNGKLSLKLLQSEHKEDEAQYVDTVLVF
ncbi:hypothetical protein CERZMDRAFT_101828 [Cercospora zeae-maydis SCOH1-5]|uniref:Uncharacterized protein n=1 Tax=Cercospora zeae-maydis SCOH1-5 TaxID=717836 RepID=A0A6A6F2M2_9PEZI|nr:hypothetical protein CERZMDRAFT_101828 [Cercospora zeae-maydis SCOH1-5]